MKAEARVIIEPKHGETLVVTYYVRRRQLERSGGGLEHAVAFMNRDVTRRVLSWKKRWAES